MCKTLVARTTRDLNRRFTACGNARGAVFTTRDVNQSGSSRARGARAYAPRAGRVFAARAKASAVAVRAWVGGNILVRAYFAARRAIAASNV